MSIKLFLLRFCSRRMTWWLQMYCIVSVQFHHSPTTTRGSSQHFKEESERINRTVPEPRTTHRMPLYRKINYLDSKASMHTHFTAEGRAGHGLLMFSEEHSNNPMKYGEHIWPWQTCLEEEMHYISSWKLHANREMLGTRHSNRFHIIYQRMSIKIYQDLFK